MRAFRGSGGNVRATNVSSGAQEPDSVKSLVRAALCLAVVWLGAAAVCVVGNCALDLLAGPTFHRQQYAVAESLLSMKIALCRAGSWLLVPGQTRELERALALRADIREERARFPERSQSRDTASTYAAWTSPGGTAAVGSSRYGADGSDQAATAGQQTS
jgi:hypothetical protein